NPKEPDDPATPFGINKTDELFFAGLQLDAAGVSGGAPTISELSETDLSAPPTVLFQPDAGSTPWFEDGLSSRAIAQTLRAATAGDIDGDGLEETVVVYKGATAVGNAILLTTYDDKEGAFAEDSSGSPIASSTNVQDISLAAGDFNGDGSDELVVALGKGGSVEILFLAKEGSEFKVQTGATKTLSATLPNPEQLTVYTTIATGNIDYDNAEELVVIMNQIITASKDTGAARYYIYDDRTAGYAQLGTGNVEGPDANGLTKSAVVADVALGDIDADGREEIVFGGLTNIRSGGNACIAYGHLLIALDDAQQGLASLGTKFFEHFYQGCPAFSSWKMRYLHVNTVDLDGDGVKEIQANQFIYDNFVNAPPWTARPDGSGVALIPEDEFFEVNDFGWFDKSTTAVVACDVTGDGRENIIFHSANRPEVTVWGEDQVNGWSKMSSLPIAFSNAQTPDNPIIVAVNVDTDSPVLKYSEAEYRFVFTEPIIIAAMAAAPCGADIGQVIGDCRTRFGTAVLKSTDNSVSFSVSAGIHYGASAGGSFFGVKFEAEVQDKISIAASLGVTKSYELKKSVVFTSGPLEDAVIFSTIPMDQYIYTVVSHPLPELIGEKITISVPREPVVIMTEGEFYNQNVAAGSPQIDTSIFGHTPGDLFSYPRESDAVALTSGNRDLRSSPQSVDQGGGFREVDIEVTETTALDSGFEISYEREVTVTAGSVLGGFSVGASAGTNLTLTNGTSTLYSGSVGAIDADNFIANLYTYGLFAYKHRDSASGQEFEVINYWVDPPR
ncbi:MAG: VCBS repeat-containing protein, partial [Desulfobacterales bacterium]